MEVLGASSTLHVVEGPIKALALAAVGLAAVGLGGTGTCLVDKGGHRSLNQSWERVELAGRSVTVVFDAGRRTNANVARRGSAGDRPGRGRCGRPRDGNLLWRTARSGSGTRRFFSLSEARTRCAR
ncbi:MAG: DUF3854 domain-containing protein [Deltaproteobacteria bacterium]|nr:DUF3854 domain-containing protein [Deltaproteobacteria bacterium]